MKCAWPSIALAVVPAILSAQSSATWFIERARAATERYKDLGVAIADSYVKVGPDFPTMGEHWVNGELIMKAELDPARPAILTYATIGGARTLTGAVYVLALRPGEQPPAVPSGAQWHDHVGTIDEESLLFGHDRVSGADDLRLAVMHAWLWVENPAGTFATDNWALPVHRLGVSALSPVSQAASRSLSLLSDSSSYYERLFESVGELDELQSDAMRRLLRQRRTEVAQWWQRRDLRPLSQAELAELGSGWLQLQHDVAKAVPPRAAARLHRVFDHH